MTTKSDREEAKAELLKVLKPGDKVYTVLRGVSASGMFRRMERTGGNMPAKTNAGWRLGEKHPCRIISPTGEVIWGCNPNDEGSETAEEKSLVAFVVKACNCHEDLLAALRCAVSGDPSNWQEIARAAIAKAGQ